MTHSVDRARCAARAPAVMSPELHTCLEQLDGRLARTGVALELWWRDDDFDATGRALDALKRVAADTGLVPLMAAIPKRVLPGPLAALSLPADWPFCQHGWLHQSHEGAGARRSEFGEGRTRDQVRSDLLAGRRKLADLFGERYLDVFVPPWSSFAACHEAIISELGYRGFSGSGAPRAGIAPPTLQNNVHVDMLQWGGPSGPVAAPPQKIAATLDRATADLPAGARTVRVGVMTHHMSMDDAAFRSFADLAAATRTMRHMRWLSPREVFSGASAQPGTDDHAPAR